MACPPRFCYHRVPVTPLAISNNISVTVVIKVFCTFSFTFSTDATGGNIVGFITTVVSCFDQVFSAFYLVAPEAAK